MNCNRNENIEDKDIGEQYNTTSADKYLCNSHRISHGSETIISPCRGKCKSCNKKRVNGYSNPNHICNPFGYLHLIPRVM